MAGWASRGANRRCNNREAAGLKGDSPAGVGPQPRQPSAHTPPPSDPDAIGVRGDFLSAAAACAGPRRGETTKGGGCGALSSPPR